MQGNKRELLFISCQPLSSETWGKELADNNWEVKFATFGEQFGQALRESNAALVLLECSDLDFDQAIESLLLCRSGNEALAVVPVLAEASAQQVLKCIHSGASDVLLKPFDAKKLLTVVEAASKANQVVREKQRYRDQLEKTNQELKESLQVLRQDQLAGRQVQLSMLPKTPQHHHDYVIAHHIVPSLYLSGDFVGYHVLLDRYLIFYFADVSGHGASSAFVTVLLRFMLNRIIRNHVIRRDEKNLAQAPLGLAESLNRQLIATGLDKHMTLFAGSIDMKRHVLRYVVASQMPAPILVADGKARFLPGKGKPIGIFDDAEWRVEELELPKRCSLCVVSDGVFDYMPGDSAVDKEQILFDAVQANGDSLESILNSMGLVDIQEAPDDISVLFMGREL